MNTTNLLTVEDAPHIRSKTTVSSIMWTVVFSLIPAFCAGVFFFGIRAVFVTFSCVGAAVISEAVYQKLAGKKITVKDGSAVLTGLLLAFCLSSAVPWWMGVIGSIFSIVIAKQIFGGLGYNIFNPALIGRAVLLASFPVPMTSWYMPYGVVTGATPLSIVKQNLNQALPGYIDLLMGKSGGSLGETSALFLLIGAGFLLYKKIITWHVPMSFLGSLAFFSLLFGRDPLFENLAGGAVLGAFFMATDYVTKPQMPAGELIFGACAGTITAVIRKFGGYPEGVCYAILLMNAFTPIIDRYTKPVPFGTPKIKK